MRARWAARNKRTAGEDKTDAAQATCSRTANGLRTTSANTNATAAPTTTVACEQHIKHSVSPARHTAPPQRRNRSLVQTSPARSINQQQGTRAGQSTMQTLSQSQHLQLQHATPIITPQPRRVTKM